MGEVASVKALVREVATYGIERAEPAPQPAQIDEAAWGQWFGVVVEQRLTGLAVAASRARVLELSPTQEQELLSVHRDAMICALRLEQTLLALAAAFGDARVEYAVLKGSAVAHTHYVDPSWRPFGDIDVLVHAADFERVSALLAKNGFRRKFPGPRPGFVERFGNTAVHVNAEGLELDLHRTLVSGPFGQWIGADELFEETSSFALGGYHLPRLSDSSQLLNACVHASLGSRRPRLLPLRDVVQIAGSDDVDWERLADRAARWRLGPVFDHAFAIAGRELGAAPPEGAGRIVRVPSGRRERRALEAYTTSRRDRGGKAVATLTAIPGLRAKGGYLRALLLPDREFIASRMAGRPHATYLRRWMVPITWLMSGRPRRTGRDRRGRA